MESRKWKVGGIKTAAKGHAHYLARTIGCRPQGSPQNHAAAAYIRQTLQDAGLKVEEQRFECPAWTCEETYLESNSRILKAAANAFSPPCDVIARSVAIGTIAELEAANLTGRIGLLYGDLTKAPLSAKSWFLKSERDDHIIRLLESKKPAALLTVQAVKGELVRVIEDWEFDIPSATVSPAVGLALLKQNAPVLHLRINSRKSRSHACNVVGRTASPDSTRIVLCAHYDTKIDTPGANDNAAGVAVLLTLAQTLSQRSCRHGLEVVAFTGEEYLPMGDDEYVRRASDRFEHIVAAINFDGVGQYLGANSITLVAGSQAFQAHVTDLTKNYPGVVWVEPWPESNHSTFSWRGVPSLAFTTEGAVNLAHLRADTCRWISPAKLQEVVLLTADIVASLQDKSPIWTRPGDSG